MAASAVPSSSNQQITDKFSEFGGDIGSLAGKIITFIPKTALPWVFKNHPLSDTWKETMYKVTYIIPQLYNFWSSPLSFFIGFSIGLISSATSFPLPALHKYEIFPLNGEDAGVGQTVAMAIFVYNLYGGTNIFEDAICGFSGGLICGNTLYHQSGLKKPIDSGMNWIRPLLPTWITGTLTPQQQQEAL